MKKIAFAAEVFGLTAIFLTVMILQLNHAAAYSSENISPSGVVKKKEKTIIHLPEKLKDQIVNESFSITQEKFFLTRAFKTKNNYEKSTDNKHCFTEFSCVKRTN